MRTDLQGRPTAMAIALYQACIKNPSSPLGKPIGAAIERNRGLVKERAMNANVSFRTAQKLKQQGVL